MAEESGGVLRELLAVFGFKVETEELAKGETQLVKFFERVERTAKVFAGLFVAKEIYEFAEANVHAMSEIEHSAARLGIAAEDVQKYQFAAKSMGLEGETLLNMMGRLQVTQDQAAKSGGEAAQAFSDIGISLSEIKGKDANEVFRLVADGLAKTTDHSKRARVAQELFGRGGRELLPILAEGSKGLDELNRAYEELGGGYSEEAIEKSKEFEKESAKLNLSLTALKSKALEKLLPIMNKLIGYFTGAVKWIREMTKNSYLLQSALGVLTAAATVFAVEMAIANAPILLITAAIAALILIIDDFVTMMEGGDSLIGDTIDRIFGKDAHVDVVREIRDIWKDIVAWVKEAGREVKLIWDAFKWWKDNLGSIGDALGDALAKGRNWVVDKSSQASGHEGRGGLTNAQNASGLNAQRVLETVIAGGDLSRVPLQLGKGETRAQELETSKQWISAILGGQFPQFSPRVEGPIPSPVVIQQTITAAQGMDEKKLGEHAAREVEKVIKQRNRAAAATLQRKAVTQ